MRGEVHACDSAAHAHARRARALRPARQPARQLTPPSPVSIPICAHAPSALAAFVGAAGLAFGLTQLLNLGKPARDAPSVPAEGQVPVKG